MKTLRCRICFNEENNETYTVREMMFGYRETFTYFQCNLCRCLQIAEMPQDMSRYYPQDYYSFSSRPLGSLKNPLEKAMRKLRDYHTVFNHGFWGRLISLTPNKKLIALSKVNLTPDSRILDVGCGAGWRLYALRELGFKNVLGIDPYIKQNIEYANGLKVLKRFVHEMQGEWDMIMYHHSFEHVPDPIENLQTASQLLPRNGVCMVRIPTVTSFAWEHYRENWVQLDAPRHYFLHSVESMKFLADKTGFNLREIVYDSTVDQFRGSELYKKGIPLTSKGTKFPKARVRTWKREAKKLNRENRGDQAVFYLVKR